MEWGLVSLVNMMDILQGMFKGIWVYILYIGGSKNITWRVSNPDNDCSQKCGKKNMVPQWLQPERPFQIVFPQVLFH